MSAIAGLVSWDGDKRSDAASLLFRRAAEARSARASTWEDDQASLALLTSTRWIGPSPEPEFYSNDGVVIALSGHVYRTRSGLATPYSTRGEQTQAISEAYRRRDHLFPAELEGEFVIVIWDQRRRRVIIATDHFGTRPLYFHARPGVLAFSSDLSGLLAMGLVRRRLNRLHVMRLLLNYREATEQTAYEGIVKLRPARSLRSDAARGTELSTYWTIGCIDVGDASGDELAARYRQLLADSVALRLVPGMSATTLSGGLDSSSITGVAAQLAQEGQTSTMPALSATFSRTHACDESRYIESVVDHCGLTSLCADIDGREILKSCLPDDGGEGEPFLNPTAVVNLAVYELAERNGLRYVLDGFGGDEVVSYGLGRFLELAAHLRLLQLWREMSMLEKNFQAGKWWMLRHQVIQPLVPLPLRRPLRAMRRRVDEATPAYLLRPDVMTEIADDNGLPSLVPFVPPARSARADHLAGLRSGTHDFSMAILDRSGASHGVETRYPFFSPDLVEFCVSVPARYQLSGGWTRAIARAGMNGVLPDAILSRATKASLTPYLIGRLRGTERALLGDAIVDHPGRLTEFVDVDRVRAALDAFDGAPTPALAINLWRLAVWSLWLRSTSAA